MHNILHIESLRDCQRITHLHAVPLLPEVVPVSAAAAVKELPAGVASGVVVPTKEVALAGTNLEHKRNVSFPELLDFKDFRGRKKNY